MGLPDATAAPVPAAPAMPEVQALPLPLAAKLWRAVFTVRPPTLLETRFTEQLLKIGQQKRNKCGCGCRWVAVAVARGSWLWLWLWLGLLARLLARLLFGVLDAI